VKVGELDRWYLSLPCSPARVQRINAVLAQVFRQCERDGTIDRNPAALAHKPEARPKAKTHMPVGVLNLLLEAAANPPALQRPGWTGVRKFRSTPVRARALAFAALTGLRRGEVAGVRYSALDLDAGMLLVSRNVVVVPGVFVNAAGSRAPRAVIKDPKAHQSATIRLNPQAVEIARRQTDWQLSFLDAINLDPAELDPFLWSTDPPFDEPITPDVLTKWFRQAAKDAGISGFTFHDLRHWRGSQQLEVGGTVRDAQEALRHRSSATTMVYLHADLSKQGALADLLPVLELPS
jgi:integrase